ncbi:low temperature requirement protein A [Streptomyces murinus]|uniref:low temperature requirement protein A n=1 Tax=Streptomyces murinus TaxID=33900 RepID=UPI000A25552D|nr:low temperature requirement protein A [Streptomyces murinus]WDO04445.1 low temperature requirement protein A [Streptomyces murinus]
MRPHCTIHPYRAGLAFALALFAVTAPPDRMRLAGRALAVVAEIPAPLVLSSHLLRQLAFGVNHLPERFDLFIIIVLGENVVSVGARVGSRRLDTTELAAVALAFRTGCGLWWLYFHLAASAVAHALRPRPRCRMDAVVREGCP